VTTVKCRGELVCGTAGELKERVRPLIPLGGRIIIDLGDVKHLDSASLGALVGLKVSAINHRAGQAHWLALAVSKFWTSTGRVTGKPEVIPR